MISLKARRGRGHARWTLAPSLLAVLAMNEPSAAQSVSQVPLVSGLTIVSALHYPEGDRENIVIVSEASAAGVRYVWRYKQTGGKSQLPDKADFTRFVRASDLAGAPRLDAVFPS